MPREPYTMEDRLPPAKLIFLSILMMLAFSFPFLSIANKSILVLGIPVLFLYLFLIWLVSVVFLWRLFGAKPGVKKDEKE